MTDSLIKPYISISHVLSGETGWLGTPDNTRVSTVQYKIPIRDFLQPVFIGSEGITLQHEIIIRSNLPDRPWLNGPG
jgi:hypothetical protein